jgi:hypothetical protein
MHGIVRPFLSLYVAWHPSFMHGRDIAKRMFDHYRGEPYQSVAGGAGLSVLYRYQAMPGSEVPAPIDMSEAETTAVVLLIDDAWSADPSWVKWAKRLVSDAASKGLSVRVFPVAIDRSALELGMRVQALRWFEWEQDRQGQREQVLLSMLSYQFCRMLRSKLAQMEHPLAAKEALQQYLRKVDVFLSHSKHDHDGARIARLLRRRLTDKYDLGTFFDVHNIPAGLPFDQVIEDTLSVSAVVALHSDSYSSREWCRREIIEAKRHHVPLVVANCLSTRDMRGFPYLGNVPIVRLMPATESRIEQLIGHLLDEVLKDFLWRCRVKLVDVSMPGVVFFPRPPELISLAGLPQSTGSTTLLVYPDPPLGAEEQRLFETVAPMVQLRSMTEWRSGVAP